MFDSNLFNLNNERPEVVIDSLPYYDEVNETDPMLIKTATNLVQKELSQNFNKFKTSTNLDVLDANYHETEALTNELSRISKNLPMDGVNLRKYETTTPSQSNLNDYSSWLQCLNNLSSQVVHQKIRHMNLISSEQIGASHWINYCDLLDKIFETYKNESDAVKKDIQDTNWKRKDSQHSAGEELKILETEWVKLIVENFQTQIEINRLSRNK